MTTTTEHPSPDAVEAFAALLALAKKNIYPHSGWAVVERAEKALTALSRPASSEQATQAANDELRELLRDIEDEVRDPDGAGTLPNDMMIRIDKALGETEPSATNQTGDL